jgi:hypothetical protein
LVLPSALPEKAKEKDHGLRFSNLLRIIGILMSVIERFADAADFLFEKYKVPS